MGWDWHRFPTVRRGASWGTKAARDAAEAHTRQAVDLRTPPSPRYRARVEFVGGCNTSQAVLFVIEGSKLIKIEIT